MKHTGIDKFFYRSINVRCFYSTFIWKIFYICLHTTHGSAFFFYWRRKMKASSYNICRSSLFTQQLIWSWFWNDSINFFPLLPTKTRCASIRALVKNNIEKKLFDFRFFPFSNCWRVYCTSYSMYYCNAIKIYSIRWKQKH